uniref:Uncharacterized protein n=1 Tax=Bionectria ochroleuca TaxID=29856 RepID=A0A0B7K548_BIOOC
MRGAFSPGHLDGGCTRSKAGLGKSSCLKRSPSPSSDASTRLLVNSELPRVTILNHTRLFCSSATSSPSGNVLALDSSLTLVAVKAREATVVTNYVVRGFPRPYSISFVAEAAGLSPESSANGEKTAPL